MQRLRSSRSGVPSQILFKDFAKVFNYFFLHFQNLGVAVFRKHLSVAAFKVINIHSLFSFIFILLPVFTNLFITLSLHNAVSFYVYVYDG